MRSIMLKAVDGLSQFGLDKLERALIFGAVLVPVSLMYLVAGRFYLARLKDGGFLAMHRECTHLGCTVPWDAAQGRFACPCHASAFDITGQVLSPPAPRPLDLYAIRIENGVVKVDTRQRLQRNAFDASQVTVA